MSANNDRNGTIPQRTHNFLHQSEDADIALVVEGKELWVNKTYLSMWSPVFKTMFFGDFRERHEDRVVLPGKTQAELEELLLCVYPTQRSVTDENCDSVLRLSREYQISAVISRCEEFLLRTGARRPIDKLLIAQEYQLQNLYNQAIDDIAGNPLFHLYDRMKQSNSRVPSPKLAELRPATKMALFDKMIEYGYKCFRSDL